MLPFIILALLFCPLVLSGSPYSENLVLQPLPYSLLASFDFRSNASQSSIDRNDYRFFPRSLSQILTHAHTKELHLRFSSGRWDEESWGPRPRNGTREGGTGIEMWAWVEADSDEQSYARWLALVNSLSGLFCASLNYIDSTRSINPLNAFTPEGSAARAANAQLWHGTLPREVVCTENLTPFMKMLPCKGKAGISSLLDGHKIFDAEWQSMAIDVRTHDGEGDRDNVEMQQSIDMVLNLERSMRPAHDPIPRPVPQETLQCAQDKPYNQFGDACYPLPPGAYPQFELGQVFGRKVKGTCPLIDSFDGYPAAVWVQPADGQAEQVREGRFMEVHDGSRKGYRPAPGEEFDITFYESQQLPQHSRQTPLVKVERTISGHGQQRGGLVTVFTNPDPLNSVDLVYLESLPWFMKAFVHTLKTEVSPVTSSTNQSAYQNQALIKSSHYQPAVDRKRAAHLELSLTVPPESRLTLTYDFEKAVLRYTEYPPDANRGFDVPPAVVRILPAPELGRTTSLYLRTTSLLLYAASPDFSMPYNVIILTSTVVALGFGSMFNILVRRFVGAEEAEAVKGSGLLAKLRNRVAALKARFGVKTKAE